MNRAIRIYIKYLRKFLAGFVSTIPFVYSNSNPYPFARENKALGKDWACLGEDINLVIKKHTRDK